MIEQLYVPSLPPALKHRTVFQTFDALPAGSSFVLVNDHDPSPLLYEMQAERGRGFDWNPIEEGPETWKIKITKHKATGTVGQIVARDIRKAEVFRKFGIDYCCGGKKSLRQACDEAQVEVATVEAALNQQDNRPAGPVLDFIQWDADFLADYIYNQHHKYYYSEGSVIADLLKKVYSRHGQSHPQLAQLYDLYHNLAAELSGHFMKEEKVLFPFIKALVVAQKNGDRTSLHQQPSLTEPIHMMEADHESAGDILAQIRKVIHQYTPPQNSCNSFKLLYQKLEDLEADLHQHVHLENNVLFPKALALEKDLNL